jgi:hypothetical protein
MKIKNHVLQEHRNIPMLKNGKRFILRIVPKEHPVARIRDCKANYYCDVWDTFQMRDKKWRVGLEEQKYRGEFATFEEVLASFKREGFKLLHPKHY